MAFLSSLNIGGSALIAQKQRMDIISQNIANVDTTRTQDGGPYIRKTAVFEEMPDNPSFKKSLKIANAKIKGGGVRINTIEEDATDLKSVYNPQHPDADENGYVLMPNVDTVKEMVDMISATRSYEANVTAFNAVKQMALKALEIGR